MHSKGLSDGRSQLLQYEPFVFVSLQLQGSVANCGSLTEAHDPLLSPLSIISSYLGGGESSICPISRLHHQLRPLFPIQVLHWTSTRQDEWEKVMPSGSPGSQTPGSSIVVSVAVWDPLILTAYSDWLLRIWASLNNSGCFCQDSLVPNPDDACRFGRQPPPFNVFDGFLTTSCPLLQGVYIGGHIGSPGGPIPNHAQLAPVGRTSSGVALHKAQPVRKPLLPAPAL
jgi:hypothetical protein